MTWLHRLSLYKRQEIDLSTLDILAVFSHLLRILEWNGADPAQTTGSSRMTLVFDVISRYAKEAPLEGYIEYFLTCDM